MQDFLAALFEFVFYVAAEGVFSAPRSGLGCVLTLAAVSIVIGAALAIVVAFTFADQPWSNTLAGLACVCGGAGFLVVGIAAAFVKAAEKR